MIDVPAHAIEPTLVAFVRQWLKLMARGEERDACAMIDGPDSFGIIWTPKRLRQALEAAFGPDSLFRERHPQGIFWTDPDKLVERACSTVVVLNDGSGYALDYPVSLNDEWSDLTAQFEFLSTSGGYAVVLHDLHVL